MRNFRRQIIKLENLETVSKMNLTTCFQFTESFDSWSWFDSERTSVKCTFSIQAQNMVLQAVFVLLKKTIIFSISPQRYKSSIDPPVLLIESFTNRLDGD